MSFRRLDSRVRILVLSAIVASIVAVALLAPSGARPATTARADDAPAKKDDPRRPEKPGWVGLTLGLVAQATLAAHDVENASLVKRAAPGSPADTAGFQPNDLIVGHDLAKTAHPRDVVTVFRSTPPGTKHVFQVIRAGNEKPIELVLTSVRQDMIGACDRAIEKGLTWLAKHQLEDGSFPHFAAEGEVAGASSTALFLRCAAVVAPERRKPIEGAIEKARAWILANQAEDGSLAEPEEVVSYRQHATSIAAWALAELGREEDREPVLRMGRFLAEHQANEETGFNRYNPGYGAMSYLDMLIPDAFRSDLSLMCHVLEGLAASGLPPEELGPVLERAGVFVRRCQNLADARVAGDEGEGGDGEGEDEDEGDDGDGGDDAATRAAMLAALDGGFAPQPDGSKGGATMLPNGDFVFRSYGTPTADGIRALLSLGVAPDDPRIVAALDWLTTRFTVRQNPGLRSGADHFQYAHALRFYLLYAASEAFSQSTDAGWLGGHRPDVVDGKQVVDVDWAWQIANHLEARQLPDGAWRNEFGGMQEDRGVVATPFAVMALERCRAALTARAKGSDR